MKLSEDRISHLSHLVCDGIWQDDLVDYTNENEALKEIKRTITRYLSLGDEADEAARAKIHSLSKDVPEGSPEWDILYRKYLEEETAKKTF
ncbi:hypothetical protein MNBD_DELTA01-1097 [hydrothermal vent metagenome]|uniref:DUF507 domain-containing protein n=1 Tax=hydrothermal vent metagenome TaxID=652676 RepID=A0A3B0QWG9_9ZZZZ